MDKKQLGGFSMFVLVVVFLMGYLNIPPAGPWIRKFFFDAKHQVTQTARQAGPQAAPAPANPHTAGACVAQMREIEAAKVKIRASRATQGTVTWSEIMTQLGRPNAPAPRCPGGGEYILGNHQIKVRCSLSGSHRL